MKHVKQLLTFAFLAMIFLACSKPTYSNSKPDITGEWVLVSAGNFDGWKPVLEVYPSGYSNEIVLRSDSTFTKTINTGSNTYTESGTYKLAKIDGKTFIAMKYSNTDVLTNNVIQSCTNSEALELTHKDTLTNIFWSPCDGADLKFARKK